MILPNIWGHGQLFAYSALDGESFFTDDLCGITLKDQIGIKFFIKKKRELIFDELDDSISFNAITGDCISYNKNDKTNNVIFISRHLVVGEGTIKVNCSGINTKKTVDDVLVIDSLDGDYTGLLIKDNKYAFSYAHSRKECIELAKKGIQADIEKEINKKLEYYNKLSLKETDEYAMLYHKCMSVMKTQLYSPEDKFKYIYSTPDRLPHKKMWLWDSVFHAIGHRYIDITLAEGLIKSIFTLQDENGFIPHMSGVNIVSSITQPSVIAWGALKLYEVNQNKEFLKEIYEHNKRFLSWCDNNRRLSSLRLYTWNTTNNPNCKCDESGMDNSSRFDIHEPLYAIDFASFMANDIRCMIKIADILGYEEDKTSYKTWLEEIIKDTREYLYSNEDGFFFDYNINKKELHKVYSVASFLPLFANIATKEQADALVNKLLDEDYFNTPLPIGSIAKCDKTFGTDMWRGPVWINFNYMVVEGLYNYGYNELASKIKNKTIETINRLYLQTGTVFEFYDCMDEKLPSQLNRKGPPHEPYDFEVKIQAIRDYGWSNTLLFDWLNERK